jgi:hypothetical protein
MTKKKSKKKFRKPGIKFRGAYKRPIGGKSKQVRDIRREYIADAYGMDLDTEAEKTSAGVRNVIYAIRLNARTAQAERFTRIRGNLYRNNITGKFVNAKQVRRYVYGRQRREEIKLFVRMYGGTKRDAELLRTHNKESFMELLDWKPDTS